MEALDRIIKEIPAKDLAIQWDMPFDVLAMEYDRGTTSNDFFKASFSSVKAGIIERVSRICANIPAEALLAFHLCYGDFRHKHFMEPEDTALLVEMANTLTETIGQLHPIAWIHMPGK